MSRERRGGGFTLTELMVAVAIIGILGAIALPSLSRVFRRDEVRRVARIVAEMFHEFRGESSASGRAMYIHIDASGSADSGYFAVEVFAQPASSCLDNDLAKQLYREEAETNRVSVVPHDPNRGGEDIWLCIKPIGRMYEFKDGAEIPFQGTMVVNVYDRLSESGPFYQVRVGSSTRARVY